MASFKEWWRWCPGEGFVAGDEHGIHCDGVRRDHHGAKTTIPSHLFRAATNYAGVGEHIVNHFEQYTLYTLAATCWIRKYFRLCERD